MGKKRAMISAYLIAVYIDDKGHLRLIIDHALFIVTRNSSSIDRTQIPLGLLTVYDECGRENKRCVENENSSVATQIVAHPWSFYVQNGVVYRIHRIKELGYKQNVVQKNSGNMRYLINEYHETSTKKLGYAMHHIETGKSIMLEDASNSLGNLHGNKTRQHKCKINSDEPAADVIRHYYGGGFESFYTTKSKG